MTTSSPHSQASVISKGFQCEVLIALPIMIVRAHCLPRPAICGYEGVYHNDTHSLFVCCSQLSVHLEAHRADYVILSRTTPQHCDVLIPRRCLDGAFLTCLPSSSYYIHWVLLWMYLRQSFTIPYAISNVLYFSPTLYPSFRVRHILHSNIVQTLFPPCALSLPPLAQNTTILLGWIHSVCVVGKDSSRSC